MNDAPAKQDVLSDEVLRSRIRRIIEEPRSLPTWERLSKNPLISLILGFLLTGVIGALLTYHFNTKLKTVELARNAEQQKSENERNERLKQLEAQQVDDRQRLANQRADHQRELDHQRKTQETALARIHSFSDQINQTRIQKIGEAWEKVYLYEAAFKEGTEAFLTTPLPPPPHALPLSELPAEVIEEYRKNGQLEKEEKDRRKAWEEYERAEIQYLDILKEKQEPSRKRYQELNDILGKNRFWIGDDSYFGIQKYIDVSQRFLSLLSRSKLSVFANKENKSERDLRRLNRERITLRANIVKIRDDLLKQ